MTNLKIPSPESITLGDYIEYKKCVDDIERVMFITKWRRDDVLRLKPSTITTTVELYNAQLKAVGEFPRILNIRIGFKKKKLGLIPNFESMQTIEYIDTEAHYNAFIQGDNEALAKFFAVLYRPIDKKLGDWYKLDEYSLDKVPYYIEFVKRISMPQINALTAFFLSLNSELLIASLSHLSNQLKSEAIH